MAVASTASGRHPYAYAPDPATPAGGCRCLGAHHLPLRDPPSDRQPLRRYRSHRSTPPAPCRLKIREAFRRAPARSAGRPGARRRAGARRARGTHP
jgi:hypothetical protein